MPRSKTARALTASPALKAPASAVKRASSIPSSPVAGVDVDVVFGQIAGPERRRTLRLSRDTEDDGNIRVIEALLHIGLIEWGGEPIAAHLHVLQGDIDLALVEVH